MCINICRTDNSLRSYQQQAKQDIFAAWNECNNVLFQMPTGTGKTRLFTSIISDIKFCSLSNRKDVKILIVAHRIELIDQISESLDKYKIRHGIIAGNKERNLRYEVQVASIQTITHHANYNVAKDLNINYIIIDEAHHATANSYRKLWNMFPLSKKLGVTATPWRMNGMGFESIFNKILISAPIKTFIEKGWLAPYSYYSINFTSSLKKEINEIQEFDIEGDYKTSALESIVDQRSIRAHLLDSYMKLAKGKKGIIYSISRKHSEHICEEFQKAGVKIVKIDSRTPKNERKLYVERFKKGLIDIIVNVDIFSEGFDCPDIDFIQLARPTKSLVKYLQQVGRGLRPNPNKKKCLILDNVGSHFEFGFPDTERDWVVAFSGTSESKVPRYSSTRQGTATSVEKNFEEGSCELTLVEDVMITNSDNSPWNETDIQLLQTLYSERKCSIEVISSVFKCSPEEVQFQINELGLEVISSNYADVSHNSCLNLHT